MSASVLLMLTLILTLFFPHRLAHSHGYTANNGVYTLVPSIEFAMELTTRPRYRLRIALTLQLLGVVASYYFFREPHYHGRSATQWLHAYHYAPFRSNASPTVQESEDALRALGTNAIPAIVRLLHARDSKFKLAAISLLRRQSFFQVPLTDVRDTRIMAFRGLVVLGKDALPAMPALIQFTNDADEQMRLMAMECLVLMEPDQNTLLPILLKLANDTDRNIQINAAYTLSMLYPQAAAKAGIYKAPLPRMSLGLN
jgi:hypothetical protein